MRGSCEGRVEVKVSYTLSPDGTVNPGISATLTGRCERIFRGEICPLKELSKKGELLGGELGPLFSVESSGQDVGGAISQVSKNWDKIRAYCQGRVS